jgi:hypothetical protein
VSQYNVFLSYSRADSAAAELLRAKIAETGLRAFLDRYALPAGQPWQPQLETALAEGRALVILLGPSGLGEWQKREIQLGLDRQAAASQTAAGSRTIAAFPVIPVLLPRLQKCEDIPVGRFLGLNTWIDLRNDLDDPEGLQRLFAGIQGQAIDGSAASKLLAGISPYRGLLPFREQDAGLFFGRERFVDELVSKVRQRTTTNTVAVVGRSGSGKSSIVFAGVFPALRKEKGFGQERGHEGSVISAVFSADGKRIVTASEDKTARLWDGETGKPIGEPFKGHEGSLMANTKRSRAMRLGDPFPLPRQAACPGDGISLVEWSAFQLLRW